MPVIAGAVILGASAVSKAVIGGIGGAKARKARRAFEATHKMEFDSPETLYNRAEGQVRYGFEPEVQAAYQQGLARENNAQFQKAQQVNPNMSAQIQSGINYGNINKMLRFIEANAREKQRKIEETYGRIERADVRAVSQNQQISGAYGRSESDYRTMMYGGLTDLGTTGALLATQGLGGGGAESTDLT